MYQKRGAPTADAMTTTDDDNRAIPMSEALKKCVSKGVDESALHECIAVYTNNGVLMLDRHDRIIFTMT